MRRRSSNWSSSITKDVRPRAVLDEWLDRELVTINGDDEIVLIDTGFVPRGDDDRKWHYLGRNLHDHIAAAAENVSGPAPRFLERAVHYDGLSPKLAKRLEARSRELAMEALKIANREANRALAKDKGGNSRWNFGVYVFQRRPRRVRPMTVVKAIRHDEAADHFASLAAGGILARRDVLAVGAGQARQ